MTIELDVKGPRADPGTGRARRTGDRAAWSGLAAMTVSFGLNFSAGVFFAPAAAAYGMDATALAVAAALSTALTGLLQPVIGTLLDRIGARAVLLAGLVFMAACYLALSVVQETWQFVVVYLVLGGIGFAASSSLALTTLIGRLRGERAGPSLARASTGINLGQLLVPWAATALFEPVGVRATYALLGAAGLAVTVVLAAALPKDRFQASAAGRESLRGRTRMLISFGLHSATLYVMVLLLPKHAVGLGWSAADAGRLVAVAAVAAGIASAVSARLLRRHRPETLLRILHAVRAVSLGLAAVVSEGPALVAVAVLFGVASFPVIPLTMAVVSRGLDRSRMGRTLAPAWLVHQLSAAAGLAVATALHAVSGDYRAYFALGLLLSTAAAALVSPGRRETVSTN
ncbi:MFS transporter [Actinomadura sp. 3N407]|uniref:MFS transporter n=1 Tax=Actinomadura sp. 3N407 TaxID=3457423 RepID=UPI003FCDEAF9